MKTRILLLVTALSLSTTITSLHAQGTAFTYQGQLNDGAGPANGTYDLRFTIYDSTNSPGIIIAGPVTNSATPVSNGLFALVLDFGGGVFTGPERWLQLDARTNSSGPFTTLSPRPKFTATPYAIMAGTAAGLPGLVIQQNTNGAPNLIGGATVNFVSSGVVGATIGGGGATNASGYAYSNSVTGDFGTVAGGTQNVAAGVATVGGGAINNATGTWATVAGGAQNTASGQAATISGGIESTSSGQYSTVAGGQLNTASGLGSMVSGGIANLATGYTSFAAGNHAQANHNGAFVWADSQNAVLASTAVNQFSVRAAGGVRLLGDVQIGTGGGDYHYLLLGGGNSNGFLYGSYPHWGDGIHLGYNYYADSIGGSHIINAGGGTSRITVGYNSIVLATGSTGVQPNFENVQVNGGTTTVNGTLTVNGTFNNLSDRHAKQDFTPVRPFQILDKVAQLPVSEWSYKTDSATRHIGPTAQDFYSAFSIGTDDKHIAPIDEGGVALAAIQGLNEKVEARSQKSEIRIQSLEAENAELKQRLDALEKIIRNQKLN